MRKRVLSLLDEAQKKMSGYAALCNYRLSNLCVKAEPVALLCVSVTVGGEDQPIEKVAKACNPDGRDDQFAIYPLERDLLFPLVKGIKIVHPEFDLDIKDVEGDEEEEEALREKYILATMPEVNDNRHDVLTQGVKAFSEVANAQIEAVFTRYTGEITLMLANAPADEMNEAKDALQELHDKHNELVQRFCDEKTKEIEDAYAAWQAAQAEKDASQQEEDAAHNALAGMGMKMNPDEEENE